MIKQWTVLVVALAMAGPALSRGQVDLSTLDRGMAGPRTQVLVLGTVHLSGMPKTFRRESLAPLIERLATYKPDIITIEAISGEGCDLFARHPAVYDPADTKTYCRDTAAAKAATGLDVPAAIAEMTRTLKAWPDKPTNAQRRRLAAVLLAANESPSALVQWLQLPVSERHPGDGLDQTLVAQLDQLITVNNEDYQIAAPLAARLGLQRVFSADDHTGDNLDVTDFKAYGAAVRQAWDAAKPRATAVLKREDELSQGDDMLALYRYLNSPADLRVIAATDMGAALKDASPQHYGQMYVAAWEARNLRMVANIRVAFREHPGARVLSIVGRTHKPWFDSFLGQMQGVDIVDAERVLGAKP